MDTKFVPASCKSPLTPQDKRLFQYTVIDEADRKRFLGWYDEASAQNTVDFLLKAFDFFGYMPKTVQTDNGFEYANTAKKPRAQDKRYL